MAGAKGSDILMKVMVDGKLLPADAQTVIDFDEKEDTLATGFASGSLFEVNDFSFNLGKSGSGTTGSDTIASLSPEQVASMLEQNRQRQEAEENPNLVVEVEPVTFTRFMDSASPALFKCLVDAKTLTSLSIIKRKAAGTAQAGRVYFRVDFIKVLLIGIDWDDEDNLVKEQVKFICRRADMKFRSQKADGTFGPTIPGSWVIAG